MIHFKFYPRDPLEILSRFFFSDGSAGILPRFFFPKIPPKNIFETFHEFFLGYSKSSFWNFSKKCFWNSSTSSFWESSKIVSSGIVGNHSWVRSWISPGASGWNPAVVASEKQKREAEVLFFGFLQDFLLKFIQNLVLELLQQFLLDFLQNRLWNGSTIPCWVYSKSFFCKPAWTSFWEPSTIFQGFLQEFLMKKTYRISFWEHFKSFFWKSSEGFFF